MSFVATVESKVVGSVMCGHDGRRGYLHHLVVLPAYRQQGIGEPLATACIEALEKIGISKTHIFVFKTNTIGNRFWTEKGWVLRDEINMYSFNSSGYENA